MSFSYKLGLTVVALFLTVYQCNPVQLSPGNLLAHAPFEFPLTFSTALDV